MLREIRKTGAKIVPEFIKGRIRGRLYGYAPSKASFDFQAEQTNDHYIITINEQIKLRISPDALDDFSYHFVRNGASIEEMHGFIEAAQSRKILFDVGAHKGLFSLIFCASNDEGRAIAYEPSTVLRSDAERMACLNGFESRIELQAFAIGERSKSLNAVIGSSGFINFIDDAQSGDTLVQMTTLDDECDRLGVVPDLLKIDIESYEYEALKGARRLLAHKPVLFLELHLDQLEKRGHSPREICDDLASYGYRFYSCLGKELSQRDVYDTMNAVLRFVAR